MTRPWCFSWCCPLCDAEHSWYWERWDMPEPNSPMRMKCEGDGGCGEWVLMVLLPDDESRMVPA